MLRGVNRQQIFKEGADYEKFLQILAKSQAISAFKIFAYCLMGNHVHLLFQEGSEPIEKSMKRITVRFVYWYNAKYQRIGHLFQDRYKSEPVETDAYLLTVLRYIHQNPVKAGICGSVADYCYSSYNEYFSDTALIDRNFIFSILSSEEFVAFHAQSSDDQCLDDEDAAEQRLTDEQVQRLIESYAKCKNASDFRSLPKELKERTVKSVRAQGASIRQISRVCGESKGMVERWLR